MAVENEKPGNRIAAAGLRYILFYRNEASLTNAPLLPST